MFLISELMHNLKYMHFWKGKKCWFPPLSLPVLLKFL